MKAEASLVPLLLLFVSAVFAAEPAFVRTQLGPISEAWVGQRVPFYVDLLTTDLFAGTPSYTMPTVPGLIIMRVGDHPTVSSEEVDGTMYSVQRYELAAFASRPGEWIIPAIPVRFSSAVAGSQMPPQEHTLATQVLRFRAEMPPGTEKLGTVLSARELTVEETWNPPPGPARLGAAFTRTIRLRAQDVPGMLLPLIPEGDLPGLAVYRKPPAVRDHLERGDFTGERVETITYVCEKSGTYTLPAVTLSWWDVEAKQLKTETLAAVRFEVASAAPLDTTSGAAAEPEPLTARWMIPGLAFVFIALAALAAWRFGLSKRWQAWRQVWANTEPAQFRRLQAACRAGNARAAYTELTHWLARFDQTTAEFSLSLVNRGEERLRAELIRLQQALVGRLASWDGPALAAELDRFRRRRAQTIASPAGGHGLPPLNPSVGDRSSSSV